MLCTCLTLWLTASPATTEGSLSNHEHAVLAWGHWLPVVVVVGGGGGITMGDAVHVIHFVADSEPSYY
jgi:hypothetical protein